VTMTADWVGRNNGRGQLASTRSLIELERRTARGGRDSIDTKPVDHPTDPHGSPRCPASNRNRIPTTCWSNPSIPLRDRARSPSARRPARRRIGTRGRLQIGIGGWFRRNLHSFSQKQGRPVINRALAADPVLRNEPNAGNMDGETEVGFSVKKNRAGYTHAGPEEGRCTRGRGQPQALSSYCHMTA